MHSPHIPMVRFSLSSSHGALIRAIDIAQEYGFARSDHRVDQPDFEPTFHDAGVAGSSNGALVKQYPWILPLMQSLPDSLMTWLDPNMGSYFAFQHVSSFVMENSL
jgi:hypothetical protein